MLDLLMMVVTVGFFMACLAYAAGCQRLLTRTQGKAERETGG